MSARPSLARIVTIAVVLIGAGSLAWMLFGSMRRVETTISIPPSAQARSNDTLAAKRFLDEMGMPAECVRNLHEMPPTEHVLIHAVERRITTAERTDKLMEWVRDGGFLIIAAYLYGGTATGDSANDPLLDELGINVFPVEVDGAPWTSTQQFDGGDLLEVEFVTSHGISLVGEEDDNFVISREIGQGNVLFIQDLNFLTNDHLGEYDHARFLWHLVHFHGKRAGVTFVYSESYDTIWSLLLRYGSATLVAVLAWIAVWALRRSTRFGPMSPPRLPVRRSLMEHVDGAGHFLWNRRSHDTLVDAVRASILQRALIRQPSLAGCNAKEKADAIAELSGQPLEQTRSALLDLAPDGRNAFVDMMNTLRTLKSKL